MGGYIYHQAVGHIEELLYEGGFIIVYEWNSEVYNLCQKNLGEIEKLSEIECYKLVTSILRGSRFNEGLLGESIKNKILPNIISRLIKIKSSKEVD